MFNPGFGGPAEGTMPGRGLTTGSIFTLGRQSDAVLNFNNNGFSLSLAARYASGMEVNYTRYDYPSPARHPWEQWFCAGNPD